MQYIDSLTESSEIGPINDAPNKDPHFSVLYQQKQLPTTKTQSVRASPDKRPLSRQVVPQNLLTKQIQIQPIQSIQKDQNSPIDSNEEDESDDSLNEYSTLNNTTSLTETLKIPNGQILLNFKSNDTSRGSFD